MIDSFLKYIQFEKRYSPQTVISYETDLQQFQTFLNRDFDSTLSKDAEYSLIRSWIVSLVEAKMDPTSVNRKIACLRSYYKFLLRREVITNDPMFKIKVLKTKKKLPHFVQLNDTESFLDQPPKKGESEFESVRNNLILDLLYGTGIRLSELINLTDRSLNLSDRTIKVLGKRNKERVIPFTSKLASLLKKYILIRNKEIADYAFLLVTKNGDKLYPVLVNRIVKEYLKEANVEKKSPHVLRHTYATHLLNEGAEINAVKDLLGHSSLAATQVYTHNSIEKLKKVFEQAHPKA